MPEAIGIRIVPFCFSDDLGQNCRGVIEPHLKKKKICVMIHRRQELKPTFISRPSCANRRCCPSLFQANLKHSAKNTISGLLAYEL